MGSIGGAAPKLLSLPFFADTPVGEDRAQSQNVQNKETLHDRIRDKRKSAQFAARRDQQYPRYITRFRVLVHSRNGPTRRNRAPRNRRRDRHHKARYCRTLMALDFVPRNRCIRASMRRRSAASAWLSASPPHVGTWRRLARTAQAAEQARRAQPCHLAPRFARGGVEPSAPSRPARAASFPVMLASLGTNRSWGK